MVTPYGEPVITVTTKSDAVRADWAPTGRSLHLIDIENLLGDPRSSEPQVEAAVNAYRRKFVRPGDQAVIAANPRMALAVKGAWPGALVRVGHGKDGADHALLREAHPDDVARRFDRLVVASGDHIFEGLIMAVRARGVAALVVHRAGSASRRLRRSTRAVVMAGVPSDLDAA